MVRNNARGAVRNHSTDLENLMARGSCGCLAPSFHSYPGAQATLVRLCFSRSHTLILRAVVLSRSDLVLPDLISGMEKRGALLEPEHEANTEGDGDGWTAQG